MGKRIVATSLDKDVFEKWQDFLDKHPDKSQSELLQDIIIEELNKEGKEPIVLSPLQQARKNNPFLNESFRCKEQGTRFLVKDLICVTDPDVECRHTDCQRYIQQRLKI